MSSIKVEKVVQPELAKHDSTVLDLAFAMDCTGSMGSYIHSAQENIRTIVEKIVSAEKCDVHLALVEYRDHPPQDSSFVTRPHDFTGSVSQMKKWLDVCNASGGGDTPEAVADALHQVLKLSWRDEATKICVFIADAPPHGLSKHGDGFPKGCPDGLDPIAIIRQMAEKGITLYMVGCEPSITPYRDFFMAAAYTTGGQYVPLGNAALLAQVIIGGAQEEISLQMLMAEVNEEVMSEVTAAGGMYTDDMEKELTRKVHCKMASKGLKHKQLRSNTKALAEASEDARELSKFTNMDDFCSHWTETKGEAGPVPYSACSSRSMVRKCAPTKSKKKAKGGGIMSGITSLFSKSKDTECAAAEYDEDVDDEEGAPVDAAAPAPPASYEVAEGELAIEQTSRLVTKALYQNKLR